MDLRTTGTTPKIAVRAGMTMLWREGVPVTERPRPAGGGPAEGVQEQGILEERVPEEGLPEGGFWRRGFQRRGSTFFKLIWESGPRNDIFHSIKKNITAFTYVQKHKNKRKRH